MIKYRNDEMSAHHYCTYNETDTCSTRNQEFATINRSNESKIETNNSFYVVILTEVNPEKDPMLSRWLKGEESKVLLRSAIIEG